MRPVKLPKSTRLNSLSHSFVRILVGIGILAVSPLLFAFGQEISTRPAPVLPGSNPCPRSPVGSSVQQPPDLFSINGMLKVGFSYQLTTNSNGNLLHLFMTDGMEDATLEANPSDILNITVNNNTPQQLFGKIFNPSNCEDIVVQFSPPLTSIQTAKKNNFQLRVTSWVACTRSHKVCGPGSDVTTKIVDSLSDTKA